MFRTDELTLSVRLMSVAQSAGSEEHNANAHLEPLVPTERVRTSRVAPVVRVLPQTPRAILRVGSPRLVGPVTPDSPMLIVTGANQASGKAVTVHFAPQGRTVNPELHKLPVALALGRSNCRPFA